MSHPAISKEPSVLPPSLLETGAAANNPSLSQSLDDADFSHLLNTALLQISELFACFICEDKEVADAPTGEDPVEASSASSQSTAEEPEAFQSDSFAAIAQRNASIILDENKISQDRNTYTNEENEREDKIQVQWIIEAKTRVTDLIQMLQRELLKEISTHLQQQKKNCEQQEKQKEQSHESRQKQEQTVQKRDRQQIVMNQEKLSMAKIYHRPDELAQKEHKIEKGKKTTSSYEGNAVHKPA